MILSPPSPVVGKKWCTLEASDDFPWVDVFPLNDLEPHHSDGCGCGVEVEFVRGVECRVHSAFDGREIVERVEAGLAP